MTDLLVNNSTVSDALGEHGDIYLASNARYYDMYQLTNLNFGYATTVNVGSNNFDTLVYIYNADTNQIVAWDDDSGLGSNSSVTFTPAPGDQNSYYAIVTSASWNSTGAYNISLSQSA